MTAVGHCLTGLCFASLVVPRSCARKRLAFTGFALVATVPDLPLPFWGHFNYQVSHSLFVNLAAVAVVAGLLTLPRARRSDAAWRWAVAAGAATWMSHLLLDSLYSHGKGVRIFWPFSDAALALPIPWFRVLRPDLIGDPAALRIFAIEAVFYGALLGACLIWRWRWMPAPSAQRRP